VFPLAILIGYVLIRFVLPALELHRTERSNPHPPTGNQSPQN